MANRARGELGIVSFQLGDISTGIIQLGQAMSVARSNGDVPALVRWLTIFGDGTRSLPPQQALDYYDQALQAAKTVPELHFPEMTYLGKGVALVKLKRFAEAEQLLNTALAVAEHANAYGYEAEITRSLGEIAFQTKKTTEAVSLLTRSADLARRAGGERILAEVAIDLADIQRATNQSAAAERTLNEGIVQARRIAERYLLPRLLGELADLRTSQHRYDDARSLLEEASDILEGLLTKVSSPWVRSRVIGGMDSVFAARIRLEAATDHDPSRAFTVLEEVRGRSLLGLLLDKPVASVPPSPEVRARQRELSALQVKLLRSTDRQNRQHLLDQIFVAEAQLAPVATELFNRTRTSPRKPLTLTDVQRALRPDEVFLEFALSDPALYCVIATAHSARVQPLPSGSAIEAQVARVLKPVRDGQAAGPGVRRLGTILLRRSPRSHGCDASSSARTAT